MIHVQRLLHILTIACVIWIASATAAHADLVIFHNGDFKFGNVQVHNASKEVWIDADGEIKRYWERQVRDIIRDVGPPQHGEVLQLPGFVYSTTPTIPSVTAPITHRNVLKSGNEDEREIAFDVEDGFDVNTIHLMGARYGFFNRPGSYLVLILENIQTTSWKGTQFRLTFYGEDDKLLASKDFYVWNLAGSNQKLIPKIVKNIAIPDVPYNMIQRIRLVRKF